MGVVRRGCLVPLLTAAVLLVGLVVGVDRLSLYLAERAAGSALGRAGVERGDVQLHGFPFLTQLASRRFGQMEVTADSWDRAGLRVSDVRLALHDVRASAATSAVVGKLNGSFLVPYAVVERRAGLPAGSLDTVGSRVRVTRSVRVAGRTVTASAAASVRVEGRTLVITPVRQVEVRYPMSGLPSGVTVESVRPVPGGLAVTVSGTDVALSP